MEIIVALIVGLIAGFGIAFIVARKYNMADADELRNLQVQLAERSTALEERTSQRDEAQKRLAEVSEKLSTTTQELAKVRAEDQTRQEEMKRTQEQLDTHFKGIASQVVQDTSEEFRKQAQEAFKRQRELSDKDLESRQIAVDNLVKPVGETLEKLQKHVGEIEKDREGAYVQVHEAVKQARQEIIQLRSETNQLHRALRSTRERGDWGEQQLRRVVEAAGMLEHVEFIEQPSVGTGRRRLRPDMVVTIPGDKQIVVDAKAPMDAYLDAFETDDPQQQQTHFRRHADALAARAKELSGREYTSSIPGSFDFAVMYVPHDAILDAAERAKVGVWDNAWKQHRVLIATPGLLIALLRTIAIGWQQAKVQENAEKIAQAAGELYSRIRIYGGHVSEVGKALHKAVTCYNDSIGSLERRVLVQARRLEDLGATVDEQQIAALNPIETDIRPISSPDLRGEGKGAD